MFQPILLTCLLGGELLQFQPRALGMLGMFSTIELLCHHDNSILQK